MIRYGKTAQNAISAMSCLAEVYDGGGTRMSSSDISKRRAISQALVAKILVVLSQSGLVTAAPGPRGGYWLAKEPNQIALVDIVDLFEKPSDRLQCPFGPDWCGHGAPCPLHDPLAALNAQFSGFLEGTTLAVFLLQGHAT
jgi:Rrf2 family iron-sulfur cluster assembly transcriptional regulator